MLRDGLRFLSFVFLALALGGSLAHLYELPNKIGLSRDDYLTVQQIYRGWALLGVAVFGALASTLALAVAVRRQRRALVLTLIAFLAVAGTQVVFWVYTYPVNQATENWTSLTQDWEILRRQWEYSHAAGAVLNVVAYIALVLSVLPGERPP